MHRSTALARALCLGLVLATMLAAAPASGKQGGKQDPRVAEVVVRPGNHVLVTSDLRPGVVGSCTAAFLFADRKTQYMVTGGHCVHAGGETDPRTWETPDAAIYGVGEAPIDPADLPKVTDAHTGLEIGRVIYSINDYRVTGQFRRYSWRDGQVTTDDDPTASPPGLDIAIVRLHPWIATDPAVCHWGGPTGLYTETTLTPFSVKLFGNSPLGTPRTSGALTAARPALHEVDALLAGHGYARPKTLVPAREGVALRGAPNRQYVEAVVPTFSGDSGGPVMTADGRAIGLTQLGTVVADASSGPDAGNVWLARLDVFLPWFAKRTGVNLTLQTAPLNPIARGPVATDERCVGATS